MADRIAKPKGRNERPAPPTVKPPAESVVRSLSDEDQVLLATLLAEPPEFVADPRLCKPGVEQSLYGVETKLTSASGTRFIRPNPVVQRDLRSGSRVPTLTADQEQILFLRFNYARKMSLEILQAHEGRRLPAASMRQLLAWGHRALSVRSEIVQFNLPLVLAMAKRTRLNGIDANELISEGNVALLRSVEKFDCGRGFKFSTYACRAILKSFSRVAMRVSRYRLRFPVEFDPSMERSDFLDRKRDGIEEDCVEELKNILVRNIAELNEVEQTVIKERFALDRRVSPEAASPKTLEQVGCLIGVTKERVRQIQNRALKKIRVALENEYLVA